MISRFVSASAVRAALIESLLIGAGCRVVGQARNHPSERALLGRKQARRMLNAATTTKIARVEA